MKVLKNAVSQILFPSYAYVFMQNFLNEFEINQIINFPGKLEDGKVVADKNENSQNPEVVNDIRRSKVKFFNKNDHTFWLFDKINMCVSSLNEEFFDYDLIGYDYLQYTEYHEKDKGHYDFHLDMGFDGPDWGFSLRKLSFVILLSDLSDFDGGDFEISLGKNTMKVEEFQKGTIIAFPSFLAHRVTPVTRGTRKTLVGWVMGPKFR